MVYEIRLKTGFYETKLYNLSIKDQRIAILNNEEEIIVIDDDDLLCVSVTERNNIEIEIQTKTKVYSGTIAAASASRLLDDLKRELNKKILYEGGKFNG
mgnify:CR=1 FL=1